MMGASRLFPMHRRMLLKKTTIDGIELGKKRSVSAVPSDMNIYFIDVPEVKVCKKAVDCPESAECCCSFKYYDKLLQACMRKKHCPIVGGKCDSTFGIGEGM